MKRNHNAGYKLKLGAVLALGLAGGLTVQSWATIIQNGGFESPDLDLGPQGYAYTTTFGTLSTTALNSWTLGPSAYPGYVAVNSSATFSPLPASGIQAVFIQGTGQISQLATFAASPYVLSFDLSAGFFGATEPLQVTIGGSPITFASVSTVTPLLDGLWHTYTSDPFVIATPGSYNVVIAGTVPWPGGAGNKVDIDNVAITVFVPEPTTVGLLALGGLILFRRRAPRCGGQG